jgi:phosphoglycerate dehydrogenase-like enzyme
MMRRDGWRRRWTRAPKRVRHAATGISRHELRGHRAGGARRHQSAGQRVEDTMPHVLLVDSFLAPELEHFRRLLPQDVTLTVATGYDDAEFAQLAAKADVLVNTLRRIDANALAVAPRVRFIQQFGVGYEVIDPAAVMAAGVVVAHNPGVNAVAVAEHTVLLMLALVKNLAWSEHWARQGQFMLDQMPETGIGDLADATVGLIGLGAIGQAVAERLAAFGSRVDYHTRARRAEAIEARLGVRWAPLPDLLQRSNIVSLHLPLTAETRHLIGEAELALMPHGAYLINTARGELIDEAALRYAISSGHLAGAGLDVVADETAGRNPFADLPQVLVTLHLGGASHGSMQGMVERSAANIRRFLAGEPVHDLIPGLTRTAQDPR